MSMADLLLNRSDRYRYLYEMHADKGISDIHSGMGGDSFYYHWIGETFHTAGCQGTARFLMGEYQYFFQLIFHSTGSFYYQSTVYMLAPLHRQIQSLLLYKRQQAV